MTKAEIHEYVDNLTPQERIKLTRSPVFLRHCAQLGEEANRRRDVRALIRMFFGFLFI